MGRLAIFHDRGEGWLGGADAESEGMRKLPDHAEVAGGMRRIRHPGSDTELQLFECRTGPNQQVQAHAHTEDEIIYVLSGSMRFGAQVLEAGDSVYIPGLTLYSFSSGADGLHFLNFRPRRDETHFFKEQLVERRRGQR